eukprot:6473678-Alexandrium_andersonii.AAC.1
MVGVALLVLLHCTAEPAAGLAAWDTFDAILADAWGRSSSLLASPRNVSNATDARDGLSKSPGS